VKSANIECGPHVSITVGVDQPFVSVMVWRNSIHAIAYLGPVEIDALIRALAAARVEISKEPPTSFRDPGRKLG